MNAPPDVPRSRLTGVPGWLTENEELLLKHYAEGVAEDGYIVNIGVEYGRSLSILSKYSPCKTILGVDIKILSSVQPNMSQAGLHKRYFLLESDSARVPWDDHFIDLVFVDGDHSIAGVTRDIQTWAQRLRIGGIIAFHDVANPTNKTPHPVHYDVAKAIMEWQNIVGADWQLDNAADSIVAYKRIA